MPDAEGTRRRYIVVTLLVAGILLLLIGAGGIVLYHQPAGGTQIAGHSTPSRQALLRLLYTLVLLVLMFTVSTLAFLRWSRGFRRLILRKPTAPTPAEDVWQMHRLPPEAEPPEFDELAGGTEPP